MDKILLILIAVVIIGVGAFFWFKPANYIPSFDPSLTPSTEKIKEDSKQIVDDTKISLQDTISNTANSTNKSLDAAVAAILGTPTVNPSPSASNPPNPAPQLTVSPIPTPIPSPIPGNSEPTLTIFDFQKDHNLRLNLTRNTPYVWQFQNVPDNFCLYIGNQQYILDPSKAVRVTFTSQGTFAVKTDFCNPTVKDLGEFVVQ